MKIFFLCGIKAGGFVMQASINAIKNSLQEMIEMRASIIDDHLSFPEKHAAILQRLYTLHTKDVPELLQVLLKGVPVLADQEDEVDYNVHEVYAALCDTEQLHDIVQSLQHGHKKAEVFLVKDRLKKIVAEMRTCLWIIKSGDNN